jgi:chorismate mutase/prephenate dehydratase
MNGNLKRLAALRSGVDAVDRRILDTLNRRLALVRRIARVKREERLPVFAPEREEAILRALAARNRGPLTTAALRAVYGEILSAARAAEEPVRAAYFGPEASFTHLAARSRFGSQAVLVSVPTIGDVFAEVERGDAEYGVVPVENSTEGTVNYTLDMFIDSDLKICAEVLLPVEHTLMATREGLSGIRTVYSHPHVFPQCRRWLQERLRQARMVEVSSTSEAARRAARERGTAAIGTELAAGLNGLKVLARNIQDMADNHTRFLVLSRQSSGRTGRDKTSIMFSVKDRVGALYDMLLPFRRNRINLTSIESRPSRRRAWEYYFFVDFLGHASEPRAAKGLRELERVSSLLKLLGSYAVAEPPSSAAPGVGEADTRLASHRNPGRRA